jgi:hypothetical protein
MLLYLHRGMALYACEIELHCEYLYNSVAISIIKPFSTSIEAKCFNARCSMLVVLTFHIYNLYRSFVFQLYVVRPLA